METESKTTEEQETITPARRSELLDELKGCVKQAHDGDAEAL